MARRPEDLARTLLDQYGSKGLGIESNVDRLLRFASLVSQEPIEEVHRYHRTLREAAARSSDTKRYGSLTLAALAIAMSLERRGEKVAKYLDDHGRLPIDRENLTDL